jgi:hypothetical protein
VVVAVLVVIALRLPRARRSVPGKVPPAAPTVSPWFVLVTSLAGGAVFMLGDHFLPAWLSPIVMIADYVAVIALVLRWSRGAAWNGWHRLALAAGAVLTYAWNSFRMHPISGGGPVITPVSHVLFAVAAVALLLEVARRTAKVAEVPDEAEPALVG